MTNAEKKEVASLINSLIVSKEFIVETKNKKSKKAQKSYKIWAAEYVASHNKLIDLGIPMVCGKIAFDAASRNIIMEGA